MDIEDSKGFLFFIFHLVQDKLKFGLPIDPKLWVYLLRFCNYSGGKNTRMNYQGDPVLASK